MPLEGEMGDCCVVNIREKQKSGDICILPKSTAQHITNILIDKLK
jgi:hypothetical protein